MSFQRRIRPDVRDAPALSRRDFLRLHVSEGRRVLELSCERLFMRFHDACSGAGRRQVSNHDESTDADQSPTGFETPGPEALFAELERELSGADELRVLEPSWLDGSTFGRELGVRVEAFEQRGGRVELGAVSAEELAADGASRT